MNASFQLYNPDFFQVQIYRYKNGRVVDCYRNIKSRLIN